MTPGRYTDECGCEDGGVNFHGDCISGNANTFSGEYNGQCRLSFMIMINYEESEICDYQYSYDVDAFVVRKCGVNTEPGEFINSNTRCEENYNDETKITRYSYTIPDKGVEEIEVVFDVVDRATAEVLESETVIVKKI